MKEIVYTITDPEGIHARPAGLLVKEAKKFQSECTVTKGDKTKKCRCEENSWCYGTWREMWSGNCFEG